MTTKTFFVIVGVLGALVVVCVVAGGIAASMSTAGGGSEWDGDMSTCVPEQMVRTPLDRDQQQVVCEDGRKFVIPMEPSY